MEFNNELGSNINGRVAEGTTTTSIYQESTTSIQNNLEQRTTEETTRETEKKVSETNTSSETSKVNTEETTTETQSQESKTKSEKTTTDSFTEKEESSGNERANRVGNSDGSKTDVRRNSTNIGTKRKEVKQKITSKKVLDKLY